MFWASIKITYKIFNFHDIYFTKNQLIDNMRQYKTTDLIFITIYLASIHVYALQSLI